MEGLGRDVSTMGTARTTIMYNQSIYRRREDDMNSIVMLLSGSAQENEIQNQMMTRWKREAEADINYGPGQSTTTESA